MSQEAISEEWIQRLIDLEILKIRNASQESQLQKFLPHILVKRAIWIKLNFGQFLIIQGVPIYQFNGMCNMCGKESIRMREFREIIKFWSILDSKRGHTSAVWLRLGGKIFFSNIRLWQLVTFKPLPTENHSTSLERSWPYY